MMGLPPLQRAFGQGTGVLLQDNGRDHKQKGVRGVGGRAVVLKAALKRNCKILRPDRAGRGGGDCLKGS